MAQTISKVLFYVLYHITEVNLEQNLLSVEQVASDENEKFYNNLMKHQ